MPLTFHPRPARRRARQLPIPLLLLLPLLLLPPDLAVRPAAAAPGDIVAAVIGVHAEMPADARTADTLGSERDGTGVVIDGEGLVLTIGYLILEASAVDLDDAQGRRVPAEVVGYDGETGFGLVRARLPLAAKPVPLGRSAEVRIGDPLLVISRAEGRLQGRQTRLVDRREFAGAWEYLLPDALMTSPAHPAFGGAALLDVGGRLVGIGSLGLARRYRPGRGLARQHVRAGGRAAADPRRSPGVRPARRARRPGLASLRAKARAAVRGGQRHRAGEPGRAAGLAPGDAVLAVGGPAGRRLADFYRRVWNLGAAGVTVPLQVERGAVVVGVAVTSGDRLRWLKLNETY